MALKDCSKCGVATDTTELVVHAKRDFEPLCLDCWEVMHYRKDENWH